MLANRGVTLILLSLMTRLGSPKDVLTLQPNRPLFFTGETVTLRCLGRPFKHYGFMWYRNESNILVSKHTSHENIYTIAPVTEAHSGVYYCSAESMSDPVRLNVSAMSKPPTVSLLPVPSSASPPDALICVIQDFYPKSLTVTWRVNGETLTGSASTWQAEKQASGLFSASSIVNVDRTKWDRNEEYTCEVLHQQETIEQKISRDQPCLEVTLNPPKVRELFENNLVVLDCVITGEERAAVEGASVTWTPSGTGNSTKESEITQQGDLFRKTSTLTLGRERWITEQNVQCSVQQKNGNKPAIKKSFSRNTSGSKVPKGVIYTPSEEEDSEFVSLVCVVAGFSPWDVFVMWSVDYRFYEEGITSEPVERDNGIFSVTSFFKVPTAKWKSLSRVTCIVKHISMRKDAAPITTSVSRATGYEIECD